MKRILAGLAALLFSTSGCDNALETAGSPSPALWQIESSSGAVEGWLFGTIHTLPDGTQWRTETFDDVFADAEVLAVEIADFDNPEVIRQLSTTVGLGPLSQRVSSDRRGTLRRMMRQAGLRENQFTNTEDWAAAIALAQISRDGDPANGIDQALIREARNPFSGREPIRLFELEGMYAQLSIFDRLPASDQRSLLHSAIDEYDSSGSEAEELRQLWISGNESGLGQAVAESFQDSPILYKALMTNRNVTMAEKIVTILETDEQPLVAVGAAHMVGADGLPELLRSKGYKLRRIQ